MAPDPVWAPPAALEGTKTVHVLNKVDLLKGDVLPDERGDAEVYLSAKTGEGLGSLIAALEREAKVRIGGLGAASMTRSRHRQELVPARDALKRFVNQELAPELAAEDLRIAAASSRPADRADRCGRGAGRNLLGVLHRQMMHPRCSVSRETVLRL